MFFTCDFTPSSMEFGVRAFSLVLLFLFGTITFSGSSSAETRLLMVEESWCEWCERWNAEIGGIYPKTIEGKRAPLWRTDIHEPLPEGVVLKTRAQFTPTFVLLKDGQEVGRIEGYPGEDFFWGMLNQIMKKLPPETASAKGS